MTTQYLLVHESRGRLRWVLYMGVAALLGGCADRIPTEPLDQRRRALLTGELPSSIVSRHIVLLRPDVASATAVAQTLRATFGGVPYYAYEHALKGFAIANLPPAGLAAIRSHPLVRAVFPDERQQALEVQQLPLTAGSYGESILWALDRVDQRLAFDGRFEYFHCGAGSHIYIVDSGIRGGHVEWGYGRIGTSVTRLHFSNNASPTVDQSGHGTAVASAAAGNTIGVAKCATLHSVRIDDAAPSSFPWGWGAWESDIVAGIDWVAGNAERPAVLNLSYTGSFSVRDALEGAIRAGVTVVTAAGNDNVDAYQSRKNRAKGAIVVGASSRYDSRAYFSNFGSLLTAFAPGQDVYLAGNGCDNCTRIESGTSFASPMVAGVVAILQQQEPSSGPARMKDLVTRSGTTGRLANVGSGSPNRLLFSKVLATDYPPPPSNYYPTAPVITGPELVRPSESCWWTTTVGSVATPATYEWYVDEVLQPASGEILFFSPGSQPFQIEVKITDANGTVWMNSYYVNVSSTAPQCPEVM